MGIRALTHSELISELIEPILLEHDGAEVQSTEESLAIVDSLNNSILGGEDVSNINALKDLAGGVGDECNKDQPMEHCCNNLFDCSSRDQ